MASIGENGYLKRLKDVLFSNPSNGDVVTYENADGKWENKPGGGGGGGGFSGATTIANLEWTGGTVTTTPVDIAWTSANIYTPGGVATPIASWSAGTPTDLVLGDGLYLYTLSVFAHGGASTTASSPSYLQVTAGSTIVDVSDLTAALLSAGANSTYSTVTAPIDPSHEVSGIIQATNGDGILSLSAQAQTHNVTVSAINLGLVLLQAGPLS